jgi:hypothetical protein
MAEFDDAPAEQITIPVTFDGRTRNIVVNANDRVDDIAKLYRLDTRQYAFYDNDNGILDLGALVCDYEQGIRIIQNPKGA